MIRYCTLKVSSDCNPFHRYDIGAAAVANELWVDSDNSESLRVGSRLSPVVGWLVQPQLLGWLYLLMLHLIRHVLAKVDILACQTLAQFFDILCLQAPSVTVPF
jgi:hypothetical protein